MSSTLFGFLLMGSAIIVMGALNGFQLSMKKALRYPKTWPMWVFIYYVGALMVATGRGYSDWWDHLGYAMATVFFGFMLLGLSAYFWLCVFSGLRRLVKWYYNIVFANDS